MAAPAPEPEADLVRACAQGDAAAWARFVDRFGPIVAVLARRMLRRRTGRAADADVDEACAGVFLALLQGDRRLLRRYRPEYRLSTYLGVICRTQVGKMLRRGGAGEATGAGPAREDATAAAGAPGPGPLESLARREREEALASLRQALDGLAPRDRLLLTLRFFDGLDYAQIAQVLRIRPDSVGPLLHRAKMRLARRVPELAHWAEDERPGSSPGGG